MNKIPQGTKTKVATSKRSYLPGIVITLVILLILISILFNKMGSPKTIESKLILTASQADTRKNLAPKIQDTKAEAAIVKPHPIEQPELPDPITSEIMSSLQIKLEQQKLRNQISSAQRRLTAPSQVYQNTSDNPKLDENAISQLFDANNQFANSVANQKQMTMSAKQQEVTDEKIFQGKIIPAVLDTAVNSDLPGMARATISEDVYGETGRKILLPRGTRLIGQYDSAIATGQVRVYIIWSRAITPEQVDIQLASPGVDALGRGGLSGDVDNHFWDIFGTSLLLSTMAAGVSDMETNNDNYYGNPYQNEVVESFTDNSDKILSKRLNIKPTITIDQGTTVRVMVAHDLDFSEIKS